MNVYIPLAIILVFLCYFMRQSEVQAKYTFFFSFFVIFIFAAIRYRFGPDYDSYWNIYEHIKGDYDFDYTGTGGKAEKWFLFYLSRFPSYTFFIVVNTFLWILANYLFLSKYSKRTDSWLIILYFFFNTTYFRLSLVALRSAMSAFIFIFALIILLHYREKKFSKLLFVAIVILAGQFHTSCLALVPLVFLTKSKKSFFFSPWLLIIALVIGVLSFALGHNVFMEELGEFVVDNIHSMSRYSEEGGYIFGNSGTLFTFLYMTSTVVIAYYLIQAGKTETDPVYVIIYKIAVLASMVQLMFGQSMIQERYFMFFNPCYIVALLRARFKNPKWLSIIIFIIVATSSIYILESKSSKNYSSTFQVYHTIFSAPSIP